MKNVAASRTTSATRVDGGGPEMNALGSGLFSRSPIITTVYYSESQEEFQLLLEEFRNRYAPQGAHEENLVRTLAYAFHSRKRGELYENALIRRNGLERMQELVETFGIPALKKDLQDCKEGIDRSKSMVNAINLLREDFEQGIDFPFSKHLWALEIIYEYIWPNADVATQMVMERGWKLRRFHLLMKENEYPTDSAVNWCDKVNSIIKQQQQQEELRAFQISKELKAKQKELKQSMRRESLLCLVPKKEDLEVLDRFYAIKDRDIARTFDQLAKDQLMRLNNQQLPQGRSLPGSGGRSANSNQIIPIQQIIEKKEAQDDID